MLKIPKNTPENQENRKKIGKNPPENLVEELGKKTQNSEKYSGKFGKIIQKTRQDTPENQKKILRKIRKYIYEKKIGNSEKQKRNRKNTPKKQEKQL